MTIRNLDFLFKPRAIALLSRGNRPDAMDTQLIQNLVQSGFKGPVMPINPDRRAIRGMLTYRDVSQLPVVPDLALIATPLAQAPAAIRQLGERGCRACVLLNDAGFGSGREITLQQAILDAARPHLMRIVGPDNIGLAAPHHGLNATLSAIPVLKGHLSLISQSGAVIRVMMDWASSNGIGFAHLASVGAKLDVDAADLLDYLTRDAHSKAVLLYLENVRDARKFLSAARACARVKPVIVFKPIESGGALDDAYYDAAFRRAGILRVNRFEQMFNAVNTLALAKPVYNHRLAILGNSHSLGLIAMDVLHRQRARLAELPQDLINQIEDLAAGISVTNPVDLGDNCLPETYSKVLKLLLDAPNLDAVLVMHAPNSVESSVALADTIAATAKAHRRAVFTCWVGGHSAMKGRQVFETEGIPTYANPGDAVLAFHQVYRYQRSKELLMETPPSLPSAFHTDPQRAHDLIRQVLGQQRERLNLLEIQQLFACYDIPMVTTEFAVSPEQAARIASDLDTNVALKIVSPDLPSKSAVGGVAFDLENAMQVHREASAMLQRVQQLAPDARIEGFVVQPMLQRGSAFEMALGVQAVPPFGPVLRFGHGGTEAAVINDVAYALPPLNLHLAREMMSRTRIDGLLCTAKGRPVNRDALAMTLIKLSQMVIDLAEIAAVDIDPLWTQTDNVLVLDAAVEVRPYVGSRRRRLAIPPYPKELEQPLPLKDGRVLMLRPILPEDEPRLQAVVQRMPLEDRRLRFFQPIKELPHATAARLTQLDYDREMAFVVTDGEGIPGQADIWAVVRMSADPDLEQAEYAIIVDRSLAGQGLGKKLMLHLIEYAKKRQIGEIYGEVLRENDKMLRLNRELGFQVNRDPDDPNLMKVSLKLREPTP